MNGLGYDRWMALLIFFAAYACFIFLPARRMLVALSAGALLLVIGGVSPAAAFSSINWNVIGVFVGNLMIADVLIESRAPAYLAEITVDRSKNKAWAIIFICLLTGAISAFVDNVATVLLIAPVALAGASFFKAQFSHAAGIICLVAGTIALVWQAWRGKVSLAAGLKSLDYDTTFFLVGIIVFVSVLLSAFVDNIPYLAVWFVWR